MTNCFRSCFRFGVTLSVLSLAGCTDRTPEAPVFPKEISTGLHSPGWALQGVTGGDLQHAPKAVLEGHPGKAWMATYAGPVTAHARVWAVSGHAVSLEIVQHWRAEPNTVVFYNDRFFTAVDYQPVERDALAALVRALEKAQASRNK